MKEKMFIYFRKPHVPWVLQKNIDLPCHKKRILLTWHYCNRNPEWYIV